METNSKAAVHASERQQLLTSLLDSVKQCQVRFGGKGELATESDSRVSVLCQAWENVLQHGMKAMNKALAALIQVTEFTGLSNLTKGSVLSEMRNKEVEPVFWHFTREFLGKHEVERYGLLKKVTSDSGKGRSWLRSALNEHQLEKAMHTYVGSTKLLGQFYEDWAFLREPERSSMLPNMAAGLGSIYFAISIDNPDLNRSLVNKSSTGGGGGASGNSHKRSSSFPKFSNFLSSLGPNRPDPQPVLGGDSRDAGDPARNSRKPPKLVQFEDEEEGGSDDPPSSSLSLGETSSGSLGGATGEVIPRFGSPIRRVSSNLSIQSVDSVASLNSADTDNQLSNLTPVNDGGEINPSFLAGAQRNSFSDARLCDSPSTFSLHNRGSDIPFTRTQGDGSTGSPISSSHTESMSTKELKEAIVAMMMRKDEVEDQNKELRESVEREQDRAEGLAAELADALVSAEAAQAEHSRTSESLAKENTILKDQLKKYVNAVQLLREGENDEKVLGIHLGDRQPLLPAKPKEDDDDEFSEEVSNYEAKLVQVAEMHGELLEFNEHLHKQLNSREMHLRRLREELVELRGPLPTDAQLRDAGVLSDTESWRPLVNLWMPGVFLRGSSSGSHHVYQVYIRIRDEEWNIYRRYSEFYEFHRVMKKKYPIINSCNFPPKKAMGNKDSKFVEERRTSLQSYMRKIMFHILQKDAELSSSISKITLVKTLIFFGDQDKGKNRSSKSSSAILESRNDNPIYSGT